MHNMKISKQSLLIIFLLIASIGLFSIRYFYIDDDLGNDLSDSSNTSLSNKIDYQGTTFISEYLHIEINLKDYHILTNQEMIDYLGLDDDYYKDDNIKNLLDDGQSYCELLANSKDNSSISIIVSKPKILSSINDFKSLYDAKTIGELTDEYSLNGYSDYSIDPYTKDFLDNECFITDIFYLDQYNNPVFTRSIYFNNKPYEGIIKLVSNNIDSIDEMEGRFFKHETKD